MEDGSAPIDLAVSSKLINLINEVGRVTKNGPGTMAFIGSEVNTYTGDTVVNGGTLVLARSPGNSGNNYGAAVGNLTINPGAVVRLDQNEQIRDASAVVVNGGTLDLGGRVELANLLSLNSGAVVGSGGSLWLATESRGDSFASSGSSSISATNIRIDGSIPFNVSNGTLTISSGIIDPSTPGRVHKQGAGTLILAGANSYDNATLIDAGTLRVNGSVAGSVTVNGSGTLGGNGVIGGNVAGAGKVAPGNSPGILTINGDYTQSPTSTLEIEVGGLTPGPGPVGNPNAGYDKLIVGGVATLGGRLEVPLIDPLKAAGGPAITDPPISLEFLTAGSIVGKFGSVITPGFDAIPNLAVEVAYTGTTASVTFVPKKLNLEFNDESNDGSPTWREVLQPMGTQSSWLDVTNPATPVLSADYPDIKHDLTIANNTALSQTLAVVEPLEQVFKATVGSGTGTMNLVVGNGAGAIETLNATTSVNVASNGMLCLNGGQIVAEKVNVVGGVLEGIGTIDLLGTAAPTSARTVTVSSGALDPGMNGVEAGFETGELTVRGNYTQTAAGGLKIDIASSQGNGLFDTLDVTGTATLGGTLTIDVSQFGDVVGESYTILTAGQVDDEARFDRVRVIGNDDVYFSVRYEPGSPLVATGPTAVGVAASSLSGSVTVTGGLYGDGTGNGVIDDDDATIFAALLVDNARPGYVARPGVTSISDVLSAYNFYTDGEPAGVAVIDFDDVAGFAQRYSRAQQTTLAAAYAVIDSAYQAALLSVQVPEPSAVGLSLLGALAFATRLRRRQSFGL